MLIADAGGELHPDSKELLRRAGELGLLDAECASVEQARESELSERELMGPRVPVASVRGGSAPGPDGPVPVRIYTPEGNGPFPLLVFFHGGGWVLGSIEQSDLSCRSLAASTNHVVISVGYRLAPEHPFPAALDDCYAATEWADAERELLSANDLPLAVAGTSAGGNLAASVSLLARDRAGPGIGLQVVLFPALDPALRHPSCDEFAEGYWLSRETMRWFWDLYLAGQDPETPYVSALSVDDLSDLPPAFIATAGFDVLRDEGEAYAARLIRAGVPVRVRRYPGMLHSFWEYAGVVRHAATLNREIAGVLSALYGVQWDRSPAGQEIESTEGADDTRSAGVESF